MTSVTRTTFLGGCTILAVAAVAAGAGGCCKKYKLQVADQQAKIDALDKEKAELEAARADLEKKLADLQGFNAALQEEIGKLGGDKDALAAKFADAQKDLEAKMNDIAEKQKIIEEMKKKEAAAKARLEMMKSMLGKFKSMIDSGKLKVKVKNRKMVLELPSAILFPLGSAELSEEGKATLGEIALVLKEIKDREFQVAGHTDNIPIKSKKYSSNWELSTLRAVAVVSFLQAGGVPPTSLSASGYSEYQPASGNDSEEGRAQNRRIEITLMPNLDELPDLSDLETKMDK